MMNWFCLQRCRLDELNKNGRSERFRDEKERKKKGRKRKTKGKKNHSGEGNTLKRLKGSGSGS